MSSSPMYAPAAASRAMQERAAEQARQRELERKRRAEQARLKRLQVSKAAALARLEGVASTAQELARRADFSSSARSSLGRQPGAIQHRVAELTGLIHAAADQNALAAARTQISQCERETLELQARTISAEGQARRQVAFSALTTAVRGTGHAESQRLDPDGYNQTTGLLRKLLAMLKTPDHAAFDCLLPVAVDAVHGHLAAMALARDALEGECEAAREAVGSAAQAWQALASDARDLHLDDGWGQSIPGLLRDARSALDLGDNRGALALATRLMTPLAAAGQDLDRRISALERRLLIADAARQASAELGMEVMDVSPGVNGAVVLRLQRMNGDEVLGVIGDSGSGSDRIIWRSEADVAVARVSEGVVDRPCEVAGLLEDLHRAMRPLGVETGPLDSRENPDTRPSAGAKAVPVKRQDRTQRGSAA